MGALTPYNPNVSAVVPKSVSSTPTPNALSLLQKKTQSMAKPKWHAPWKLYRVISGHLGWVRCCAIEPGNEWFATGSADRVIKVRIEPLVMKFNFKLSCV